MHPKLRSLLTWAMGVGAMIVVALGGESITLTAEESARAEPRDGDPDGP